MNLTYQQFKATYYVYHVTLMIVITVLCCCSENNNWNGFSILDEPKENSEVVLSGTENPF